MLTAPGSNISKATAKRRSKAVAAKLRDPEARCGDDDWSQFGAHYAMAKSTAEKLRHMHRLIAELHARDIRVTLLVPLMSAQAKYVTIDSGGLYDLLSDIGYETPPTVEEFQQDRLAFWRKYFRIPHDLLHSDGTVLGFKNYFNAMLSTDGVGVSLSTYKWLKCREDKDAKRPRIEEPPPEDIPRTYLALDPGNKSVYTAIRSDDINWKSSLSNSQYHKSPPQNLAQQDAHEQDNDNKGNV
ncbi:hypothetical protein FBU59_006810 [Linderina macrospora]|uniref:Uncharacterized protein n=1 Tax=Linderina macrospora TaxID=4868 RepID=A0ACC1IYS2_9FUNG|nr:hypothetical protein FBU59_006810 [Linderina macrospora]